MRAHHSMTGELVSLVVRLKNGHLHQCFPLENRGARYPSEDVWRVAVRDQLQRERRARGKFLHEAHKDARAAVQTLRHLKAVDPDLTHNDSASRLRELMDGYAEMAKKAAALAWRANRAKKDLRRALDAVRDPLEGFVGDP